MPQIKQTAKQMAINAAKQAARESNEYLRTASAQITGIEKSTPQERSQQPQGQQSEQPKLQEKSQQASQKDVSFLNVYKGELEQIRRENLFKELQRKITEGEEVPLIDYVNELTSEQREVLQAQITAVKERKEAVKKQKPESVPQIVTKKARGMLGAFKKRQQQHVETQKMPSN